MKMTSPLLALTLPQLVAILIALCSLTGLCSCTKIIPGRTPKIILEQCEDATWVNGIRKALVLSHAEGGLYRPNLDCRIHLSVSPGYLVNITLQHVDLQDPETGESECSDYLEFYNGHGTQLYLSERLCRSGPLPRSILSNRSEVTLRFKTDHRSSEGRSGFSLLYSRVHPDLLEELGVVPQELQGGRGHGDVMEQTAHRPLTKEPATKSHGEPTSLQQQKRFPFT